MNNQANENNSFVVTELERNDGKAIFYITGRDINNAMTNFLRVYYPGMVRKLMLNHDKSLGILDRVFDVTFRTTAEDRLISFNIKPFNADDV